MKKLSLVFIAIALFVVAKAQMVPLQVHNGQTFPIQLTTVITKDYSTCGGGAFQIVNVVIPAGGNYFVDPIQPGNETVRWAGAKIMTLPLTGPISHARAIHPYFESCWIPTASEGPIPMNTSWYDINAMPYQILRVYSL